MKCLVVQNFQMYYCKLLSLVMYLNNITFFFQNVSVSVSVLTLTFISVDRWYAICHPLSFKSTPGRAKTSILIIWLIALFIALPEAIVLDTKRHALPVETLYLTDCTHTWSETSTRVYQLFLILVLYVAPFTLMAYTYYQITRVLWNKNIPGSNETNHMPLRLCKYTYLAAKAIIFSLKIRKEVLKDFSF